MRLAVDITVVYGTGVARESAGLNRLVYQVALTAANSLSSAPECRHVAPCNYQYGLSPRVKQLSGLRRHGLIHERHIMT